MVAYRDFQGLAISNRGQTTLGGLERALGLGRAGENVKIIDVAQMLLASVKRGQAGADGVGAADDPPLREASVAAGGRR